MKKKVFRWIKVLILLYCIIGIAFYYLQDRFLLHPEPMDRNAEYHFDQPFKELNLNYNKETNINIIQFLPTDSAGAQSVNSAGASLKDSARGVVLYFHGNKRNNGWYARHAKDFTNKGYEVWMMDYPGFGKSTGPRTEQRFYDLALVEYKLARSRFKPSQIIIYGKSLGTGVASQLASVRDCRQLILECPYYSMTSVFSYYLPIYPVSRMMHYHFPTNECLPHVTAPITIFHGTSDRLIPFSNAQRLKPLLKAGDQFIPIEGGGA